MTIPQIHDLQGGCQEPPRGLILWLGAFHFPYKKVSAYNPSANWCFFDPSSVLLGPCALPAHTRAWFSFFVQSETSPTPATQKKNINYLTEILTVTLLSKQVRHYGLILQKQRGGAGASFLAQVTSLARAALGSGQGLAPQCLLVQMTDHTSAEASNTY